MSKPSFATDVEITRLCAEAGEIDVVFNPSYSDDGSGHYNINRWTIYQPLHDREQAMELLEKFELHVSKIKTVGLWQASTANAEFYASDPNLNRAICECVAKIQREKVTVSLVSQVVRNLER